MDRRRPRSWLPAGLIALRERNFVLYVVGQFTSQLGSWIELTAVSWIVYEMTNSPFLLGLVGLTLWVTAMFGVFFPAEFSAS